MTGCASGFKETRITNQTTSMIKPVKAEPVARVKVQPVKEYEGSLWRQNAYLSNLFLNPKARRAGDIITIKIVESSSASNQASTKTGRKSSLSGSVENFFNAEKRYPDTQPFFNPFAKVKGGLESDFDGTGSTKRSGALSAIITAVVTEVRPNGNMEIVGSREITVNNEKQLISLSGIIRPRDISPDNIILSTYISDARITYSGKGIINDRQRPGWIARLLDTVWPF